MELAVLTQGLLSEAEKMLRDRIEVASIRWRTSISLNVGQCHPFPDIDMIDELAGIR